MTRDYKHRADYREPKKAAPAWLWMLVGLLVGAFAVGLVWLKSDSEAPPQWVGARPDRPPKGVEQTRAPAVPAPESLPKPPQSEYGFYEDLGNKEVVVPEEQLDLRSSLTRDPTASYMIQIASFSRADEAEAVRAELGFIGIETRTRRVTLGDGSVRYRVLSGPYIGRSKFDKVRKLLKQNGYKQLLVKVSR